MHRTVYIDGGFGPAADARIAALSGAALYGKGIFTTVAISGSHTLVWEKHWRRLCKNAAKLGIDLSEYPESGVLDPLLELIERNAVTRGRARVTFFDLSRGRLWPHEGKRKTSLLITTADLRGISEDLRLTISPYRINSVSPLAGVKSCNYLEKLIALDEARHRGFDEAVQLNERGQIASACMANIFWLIEERLYTPSLATGCLAGTTREFVMQSIECEETEDGPDSLAEAEAIFLTSAGLRVATTAELDGRRLPRSDHEITRLLGKN